MVLVYIAVNGFSEKVASLRWTPEGNPDWVRPGAMNHDGRRLVALFSVRISGAFSLACRYVKILLAVSFDLASPVLPLSLFFASRRISVLSLLANLCSG